MTDDTKVLVKLNLSDNIYDLYRRCMQLHLGDEVVLPVSGECIIYRDCYDLSGAPCVTYPVCEAVDNAGNKYDLRTDYYGKNFYLFLKVYK